jgi:hypothetical protein
MWANELLGLDTKAAPKNRGPQSQLEKQMAAIASLPQKEQQQLLAVVETFISQHATQRALTLTIRFQVSARL